jgi:prophage regulatory protein
MRFLTFSDLSKRLGGRSRASLYRDVAAGRLPQPLRLGGRVLFVEQEVEDALATCPKGIGAHPNGSKK